MSCTADRMFLVLVLVLVALTWSRGVQTSVSRLRPEETDSELVRPTRLHVRGSSVLIIHL